MNCGIQLVPFDLPGQWLAAVALLIVLSVFPGAGAAETKVALAYSELEQPYMTVGLHVTPETKAFSKEPDLKNADCRRGRVHLPQGSSDGVAFLWDTVKGKLYLDLNKNGDLTDDPAGECEARYKNSDSYFRHANFAGVRLPMETEAGTTTLLVDFNFSEYSRQLRAYAAPRSFWSGKIVLGTREYEIGLIPTFLESQANIAYLLLRPWSEASKPFQVHDGTLDTVPFSSELSLNESHFNLSRRFVREGEVVGAELVLVQSLADCGELQVVGEHIERLMFRNGARVAVYENPRGVVKIPIGTYASSQVQLRSGDTRAVREQGARNEPLTIKVSETAQLEIGGPLTNTVSISKRGSILVFNYRLLGARGDEYVVNSRDHTKPPKFSVRQGERVLATGNFEFG